MRLRASCELAKTIGLLAIFVLTPGSVMAGNFFYVDGMVRDGSFSGSVSLGSESDYSGGPGQPHYGGDPGLISLWPAAGVSVFPEPGSAIVQFAQSGYIADTPGILDPFLGLFQQGKVEFGMHAYVSSNASPVETQLFDVDTSLGPAYVHTRTSDSGVIYELEPDGMFGEFMDDYIAVYVGVYATIEAYDGPDAYTEPFSSLDVDLAGQATGPLAEIQIIRNGDVVWVSEYDEWIAGGGSAVLEAQYGDIIEVHAGVRAEMEVDTMVVREDDNGWAGSVDVSVTGGMEFSILPGSKPEHAITATNAFGPAPYFFEILEFSEKGAGLGIDDPIWLAPLNAPGYRIEVEGSALTGLQLPELGDFLFDVFLPDPDTGEWVLYEADVWPDTTVLLPVDTNDVLITGFEEDFMYPIFSPIGLLCEDFSEPLVTIAPVPEPAAPLLLGVGALSLLAYGRRKRRRG